VTQGRECLFGEVVDGEMVLNELGKIVQWEWVNLAQSFKFIVLGAFVIMPNHFHGILFFHVVGATRPGVTGALSGNVPLLTETLV
jgi:putative transposase